MQLNMLVHIVQARYRLACYVSCSDSDSDSALARQSALASVSYKSVVDDDDKWQPVAPAV